MSELPEQLRFQDMSRPYNAVMYSNKTNAVSSNQQTTRFEIPRQGILSSNALVQFSYTPNLGGTNDFAAFPPIVGARALINRAVLSSQSGRVIMDTRRFNKKSICETNFRSAEYSRWLAPYLELSNNYFDYTKPAEPAAAQGQIRMGGVPLLANGTPSNNGLVYSNPIITRLGGTTGPAAAQSVRVSLQELFPLLYSVQIPVNIAEILYVDIYWEQDSALGDVITTPAGTTHAGAGTINQADLNLLTDNLVYLDPAVMQSIEAAQLSGGAGGLSFPYEDTNVQEVSNPDGAAPDTVFNLDRMLGCNEYKLTSIKNVNLNGQAGENNNLLGKYYSSSQGSGVLPAGGGLTRQAQYVLNEQNLYPTNDATNSINFNRLSEVYPHIDPCIPRSMYGLEGAIVNAAVPTAVDQVFNGHNMRTLLSGNYNIMGVNLKDNSGQFFQNGNAPIRLVYQMVSNIAQGNFNAAALQFYFIAYLREFSLMPSGKFVVSDHA